MHPGRWVPQPVKTTATTVQVESQNCLRQWTGNHGVDPQKYRFPLKYAFKLILGLNVSACIEFPPPSRQPTASRAPSGCVCFMFFPGETLGMPSWPLSPQGPP